MNALRSAGGLSHRARLGRALARRGLGRLRRTGFGIEVGEDLLDQRRVLDARDDAHRPAASRAHRNGAPRSARALRRGAVKPPAASA